ncbi:LytR/AlgR family response regulator transcription factor [Dinghuibacter silviterrae]|uniref:LytTR family two component transcriptional regulator n=1 Tax=Dinghuibacter silviterrae TaxID=1539049 RepID=A0A4R8DID5_9BACT|nr:response regulator transcription factor [Dinghuibacter silviterrae]TDW97501.1 LytTR family two component transcriptional regulator [Dinghuibacter silviterrae]
MMTCVILDDELPGLQYLTLLCQQIPGLEIVRAYNDPKRFLDEYGRLTFDFCILDIQMPGVSGLAVAEAIRGKPVIFTTGYKEYAAEAFDLDAVDYVRKPIDRERFEQAIRKVEARLAAAHAPTSPGPATPAHGAALAAASGAAAGFARFNSSQGKVLLHYEQVLLVTTADGDARDKNVVLENGRALLLKNVSFSQLHLPPDQFARINKKTVVRIKAITHYTAGEVTIDLPGGAQRFPLSETYRQEFYYKK